MVRLLGACWRVRTVRRRIPGRFASETTSLAAAFTRVARGREGAGRLGAAGGIVSNELTLTTQDIGVGPVKTLVAQPVLTLIDARDTLRHHARRHEIRMRQAAGPPSPGIGVIANWMAKLK